MRLIIGPRHSGRTTQLIQLCSQLGGTVRIIVPNATQKENIKGLAREMGVEIPEPVIIDRLKLQRYGDNTQGYLIDNLDQILIRLTGGLPVFVATMESEECTENENAAPD